MPRIAAEENPIHHLLASDIRERVSAFLAGSVSLADFQEWLVGATWDVEELGDPMAIDLVYDIKLTLAEHSRGDISVTETQRRLREAVAIPDRVAVPRSA